MNFFKLLPLTVVLGVVPSYGYALVVGDLLVTSKKGEALQAEVNISDITAASSEIKAQLLPTAQASEALRLLISNLEYKVVPVSANQRVVKITSKTPVNSSEISALLRVISSGNVRLKQVQATIAPADSQPVIPAQPVIPTVNTATTIVNTPTAPVELVPAVAATTKETILEPLRNLPPPMMDDPNTVEAVVTAPPTVSKPAQPDTSSAVVEKKTEVEKKAPIEKKAAVVSKTTKPQIVKTGKYTVAQHETLWLIASRLSEQNKKSINANMDALFKANPNAFVDNDPNKLRSHVTLTVRSSGGGQSLSARKARKATHAPMPKSASRTPDMAKRSGTLPSTKPEMKLVSPSQDGGAQGNNEAKGSGNSQNAAITAKIMQSRATNLGLKQKLSNLSATVSANENKLSVLNAQLAAIEAALKQKGKSTKPDPKATDKPVS